MLGTEQTCTGTRELKKPNTRASRLKHVGVCNERSR